MDKEVYKIAVGGLLHDIGKFAERGNMEISKQYWLDNEGLYCPEYNRRATHKHALYTAAFIEQYKDILPQEFNSREWISEDSPEDSLINLAAKHHKPETPLQWIVAIADRLSSGMDRVEFEDYNKGIGVRDYKKTRMFTIFEGLDVDTVSDSPQDYEYRYTLQPLSPTTIFPTRDASCRSIEGAQADTEYERLFEGFIEELKNIKHKRYIPLWLEHFDTLLMVYTTHVPAATVGKVVPDVSLYDHSRTTSAFATALYLYHRHNKKMDIEAIKDEKEEKFLIISGDFYGIQEFIFASGGSSTKFAAKLLRGRSFTISLMTELATDIICKELGLPFTSVILNAAGKFTIIAPNTEGIKAGIKRAVEAINEWLIRHFYGENTIGISMTTASPEDFQFKKFDTLWTKVGNDVERGKYKKVDINRWAGVVKDYLQGFEAQPCQFCGKRPVKEEVEGEGVCRICRDTIYIGNEIVKGRNMIITSPDAEVYGDATKEPILGRYKITFDHSGELKELAKKGTLLKYYDISIPESEEKVFKGTAIRFINGYVPVYTRDDLPEDTEDDNHRREGHVKTFEDIARISLVQEKDTTRGIEAIGVLKADIDKLGKVFESRLKRKSISRIVMLSRQINNFFCLYLPYVMNKDDRFNNIYTVFSGGDDLFFIGPWNSIIEFADFIYDEFKRYTISRLTLSAGITIHKSGEPVMQFARSAEESLDMAKSMGRDSVTLFSRTVKWKVFKSLEEIKNNIENWYRDKIINNAMLYRWNEIIEMAKEADTICKEKMFSDSRNYRALSWRALLRYNVARNVARDIKDEELRKNYIDEIAQKTCGWLDVHKDNFVIPLWQIIYGIRKSSTERRD